MDTAQRGAPLPLQGDGSQGRQFTHASDISRAFLLAAESTAAGIALNVVAPETTSIKELAEAVVAKFPTELTFGEPRPGDVSPALVSGQRANTTLGWKAEVPFNEGLDELIRGVVDG